MFNRLKFAAMVLMLVASGQAVAANILTNGSFETSLSGWTADSDGTCVIDAYQQGDALPWYFGELGVTAPAPTDGSFILVTDPDEPGTCSIYQDVSIPAGSSAVLSADVGYLFDEDFSDSTDCSVTVEVTTTGGSPIATVFSESGTTNLPIAPQPSVDLSAQAGTTVRVIASAVACEAAPIGLLLDNVVLDAAGGGGVPGAAAIPVMPVWLLVMMAGLLSYFGARNIRD